MGVIMCRDLNFKKMQVTEVLNKEIINKSIIKYFPNTGNAGDSLINVGFYHLADLISLKYDVVSKSDLNKIGCNDVVIIGGGGAIVPEWSSTTEFIENIVGSCKKIIILPQSIRGANTLLLKLRKQDIVFCREKLSYKNCIIDEMTCKNIYLDNDMAFHVNVDKLMHQKGEPDGYSIKNLIRHVFHFYHKVLRSKISNKINAFRCDKESNKNIKIPRRKINDFSSISRFGSGNQLRSIYSARKFMELIELYEVVYTDRLHVVIGASLLNKKIYALPNSYYKVQAVIEQSLKNNKNVIVLQDFKP